jgi:hypothetical protein
MLRPQDVLVLMKLLVTQDRSFHALGRDLGISPTEARNAVRRATICELFSEATRSVVRPSFAEYLVHGVRYSFPAIRGRRVRGMPTGPSAPPLSLHLASDPEDAFVWAHPTGEKRGESVSPIFRTAPFAAERDRKLYELLVLVDGIRVGRPRVRAVAADLLERRLATGSA